MYELNHTSRAVATPSRRDCEILRSVFAQKDRSRLASRVLRALARDMAAVQDREDDYFEVLEGLLAAGASGED